MKMVIPLDAMSRFSPGIPTIIINLESVLKESRVSKETLHKALVEHFTAVHNLPYEIEAMMLQIATRLELRFELSMPVVPIYNVENLLTMYAEAFYGAMWPFLQHLGYSDTKLPHLTYIRNIGDAVYVEDKNIPDL